MSISSGSSKAVVSAAQAYEYLDRALQLLEKPGPGVEGHSWIRNSEAITEDRTHCAPEDERAVAWCTIGVVKAVTKYDPQPELAYTYILSLLNMANPMVIAAGDLPTVNDHSAFDIVRQMFVKAKHLAIRFESRGIN